VLECNDGNCTDCSPQINECAPEDVGGAASLKVTCETTFASKDDIDLEKNGGGWTYSMNDSTCNQIDVAVYYNPRCLQYEGGSGMYYCKEGVFFYSDCVGSSDCSSNCRTFSYADDKCSLHDMGYRTAFCSTKSNGNRNGNSSLLLIFAILPFFLFKLFFSI